MTVFESIFYIIFCIGYYLFCYGFTYTIIKSDDKDVLLNTVSSVIAVLICIFTTPLFIGRIIADKLK